MNFAQKLKKLREKSGLTQREFAKKLKVGTGTVGMWECTDRLPPAKSLLTIAEFFNVSVDYLLSNNVYTAEDYANGVMDTKKISMTADQEDIFDKTNEVLEVLGYKGKDLIIGLCDTLIANLK